MNGKWFWALQALLGFIVFWHSQHFTVTWGWEMPSTFTPTQIVAEIWSAASYLGILISLAVLAFWKDK